MIRIVVALCLCFGSFASAVATAQSPRVSDAALRKAQTEGEVRVVVMLQVREPPSRLTGAAARKGIAPARLHPEVAPQVDAVLSALPATARARVEHRFRRVPAFAIRADARTLETLSRDPRVARVDLDVGGTGAAVPDESTVLNRAHQLPELGVGGAGMKVAVIDTGIDTDHPDLRTRIAGQRCFCSVGTGCCPNGTSNQSGAGSAEDDQGHGTNVAGIIGGDGTVAPRGALPAVSLVAVKVIDRNNRFQSTSDVVAALDWIASAHPDVDAVNLSLGTDLLLAGDCDNTAAWTQALAVAVSNLNALGAVVTASAGNQGNTGSMSAPACLRDVVSTGATWDFTGGPVNFLSCSETATAPRQIACFSNRGATTDLFAAGAFVRAPGFTGGTSSYAGTSQAAPMVAACAIALKQAAPASSVTQRVDAMTLSPTRVADPVVVRSYPFLDCRDALKLLAPAMFAPQPLEGARPRVPPRSGRAPGG